MQQVDHRPVLVTGSHRSGTTWVGQLLASSEQLHYVQEPFNIVAHQRWLSPRPTAQFLYIEARNEHPWIRPVSRVIDLDYPFVDHLRNRTAMPVRRMVTTARQARAAHRAGARALLKDPIALFSTAWLAERFEVQPIVLVRNPVAFVGSLLARRWAFDFRHWHGQPLLMAGPLAPWAHAIDRMVTHPTDDIVEQGIVQWNAFYGFVRDLERSLPEAIVIRYEDIASRPHLEVERLFARVGCAYGAAQRAAVDRLTTARDDRPASAIDVRRDSQAALETWRERLSAEQVERITAGTADIAAHWYGPTS